MLGNGFDFYSRLAARSKNGLVDPVLFNLTQVPQGIGSAYLAASRIQANAARAIDAGLGNKPSVVPPPLSACDPAIGPGAGPTPANTPAVVGVTQTPSPCGAPALPRLFDG